MRLVNQPLHQSPANAAFTLTINIPHRSIKISQLTPGMHQPRTVSIAYLLFAGC